MLISTNCLCRKAKVGAVNVATLIEGTGRDRNQMLFGTFSTSLTFLASTRLEDSLSNADNDNDRGENISNKSPKRRQNEEREPANEILWPWLAEPGLPLQTDLLSLSGYCGRELNGA